VVARARKHFAREGGEGGREGSKALRQGARGGPKMAYNPMALELKTRTQLTGQFDNARNQLTTAATCSAQPEHEKFDVTLWRPSLFNVLFSAT
jgi:hypothetical protein